MCCAGHRHVLVDTAELLLKFWPWSAAAGPGREISLPVTALAKSKSARGFVVSEIFTVLLLRKERGEN